VRTSLVALESDVRAVAGVRARKHDSVGRSHDPPVGPVSTSASTAIRRSNREPSLRRPAADDIRWTAPSGARTTSSTRHALSGGVSRRDWRRSSLAPPATAVCRRRERIGERDSPSTGKRSGSDRPRHGPAPRGRRETRYSCRPTGIQSAAQRTTFEQVRVDGRVESGPYARTAVERGDGRHTAHVADRSDPPILTEDSGAEPGFGGSETGVSELPSSCSVRSFTYILTRLKAVRVRRFVSVSETVATEWFVGPLPVGDVVFLACASDEMSGRTGIPRRSGCDVRTWIVPGSTAPPGAQHSFIDRAGHVAMTTYSRYCRPAIWTTVSSTAP
jgi:hypothetical protein